MNKILLTGLLLSSSVAFAELHDPTKPSHYLEKSPGAANVASFTLGLTLLSSDRKVVVINGLSLKVGDTIAGHRVVAVDSNSVQLVGSNGSITLFLLDTAVKQTAK